MKIRTAVAEKTEFGPHAIERIYARPAGSPMPVYRQVHFEGAKPKCARSQVDGKLTGPELLASLWPKPEPKKKQKVGPLRIDRYLIGLYACSASTKSEARSIIKAKYGPIPPGTPCRLWTH